MHIVLDIAAVAIIALTIFGAVRRGFMRSLISLAALVVSLILAYSFSASFGAVIDRSVVTPAASKIILKQSSETVTPDSPLAEFSVEDARYNKALVALYGGNSTQLVSDYNAYAAKEGAGATVGGYLDAALDARGYTQTASAAIAVVLIFIAVAIVASIVRAVVSPFMRLPVLHQFDKLLGLVVGIASCVAILMLFVAAATAVGNLIQAAGGGDYNAFIDKTYLFKYIYDSPLHTILK